jgi:hypothetical protein
MAQIFRHVFYKKVYIIGKNGVRRNVFLFKNFSKIDKGKYSLDFISAYKSRNGKDFIVESGSGISKEKMEKQVISYLKKWVD